MDETCTTSRLQVDLTAKKKNPEVSKGKSAAPDEATAWWAWSGGPVKGVFLMGHTGRPGHGASLVGLIRRLCDLTMLSMG